MPYTPSLSDVQDLIPSQGYQPSASDVADMLPPPNSQFAQQHPILSAINLGAMKGTGDLVSGLGDIVQHIKNTFSMPATNLPGVGQIAANAGLPQGVAQALQNAGQNINQNAGQLTGLNNPTPMQSNIATGAEYAPQAIGAVDTGLGLAKAGAEALAPAASAASSAIGSKVGAGMDFLTGKGVANQANNIVAPLAKNLNPDELNSVNTNNIVQVGKTMNAAGTQKFVDVGNDVAARGYARSGNNPGTMISDSQGNISVAPSDQKFIVPNASKETIVGNLPAALKKYPTSGISDNLSSAIENYNASNTFDNAHSLQTALAQEKTNLLKSVPNQSQRDFANQLSTAAKAVRKDIIDTFNNNGDSDLATQYQNARQFWRQNVVPYSKLTPIRNAMNGAGAPANILTSLQKDNPAAAAIRAHIMNNPDVSMRNSVVAQALGKSFSRDTMGNLNTDPQKLLNAYNGMPKTLRQMSNPHTEFSVMALQKALGRRKTFMPLVKKAGNIAALSLGLHI